MKRQSMGANLIDKLMADPGFKKGYCEFNRAVNRNLDWQALTLKVGIAKYIRMRVFKLSPGRVAKKLHIPHKALRFIEEYII